MAKASVRASKSFGVAFKPGKALDTLKSMSQAIESGLRPMAQAGAQIFYEEVLVRVPVMAEPAVNNGKLIEPGALKASIYQAFSADNSGRGRSTYHISWNASKAPHGHLVEYGHIMTRKAYKGRDGNWYTSPTLLETPKHVAAQPFLRPAWDTAAQRAAEAARDRFIEDMRNFAS